MLNLRRIVSSESWVPEIDGLRFVAILVVLLFHCQAEVLSRGVQGLSLDWPRYRYLWNNFDRGVLLFFVISGFVLARPFYQQYRLGKRRGVLSQYPGAGGRVWARRTCFAWRSTLWPAS